MPTGPAMGIRYSKFPTLCKSAPGNVMVYATSGTVNALRRKSTSRQMTVIEERYFLLEDAGNIRHRRNRANIKPADIVLAAHIEATVWRHLLPP